MATCKTCGKKCDKEYCFQHKPRKPLTATKGFNAVKKEPQIQQIDEMRNFFLQIWKKRTHKSEVSGDYLGSEALHVFFHHILAKEKYPEAKLDEENIILLTLDEHSNVESDMYRYEEVNRRREQLNLKYERIKQGT
jgi:uncharacterized protein YvpB